MPWVLLLTRKIRKKSSWLFRVSRTQNISEATAQKIDAEIHRIIDECYARAKDILTTRQADLNVLARGLLEYETLTGDEIIALLKGIPPVRRMKIRCCRRGARVRPFPPPGKPRGTSGPGPIISPEPTGPLINEQIC